MRARDEIIAKLWFGHDPYAGLSPGAAREVQGWNSDHAYLSRAIDEVRPRIVVEVGVWKGGSAITMARRLRDLGLDAVVIAVDTWLGSWEHRLNERFYADLDHGHGYPRLFHHFMANVLQAGVQDYVVPLPLDSNNAGEVLRQRQIRPDIVHIDAGHDRMAVSNDLAVWWPQISPGGALIGDDYFADGQTWPEVRGAFDDFFRDKPVGHFESGEAKCLIGKAQTGGFLYPERVRARAGAEEADAAAAPEATGRSATRIGFALGRATRGLFGRK